MSVNIITQTSTLLSETVATSLVITRTVNPDCSATYTCTLQFGTHTFSVDANSNPTGIISLNQNPGVMGLGAEATGAIFMTPVTFNGTPTVLGEVLANMMDAQITSFLGLTGATGATGSTGDTGATGATGA